MAGGRRAVPASGVTNPPENIDERLRSGVKSEPTDVTMNPDTVKLQ